MGGGMYNRKCLCSLCTTLYTYETYVIMYMLYNPFSDIIFNNYNI